MRMAHDFRNRQHWRCGHTLTVESRQRCVPIRQGLQPTLDCLDQNLLVSQPLTESTKPRVISQFWLSHRSRQSLPLMGERRDNDDISLCRTKDSARHQTSMMRPTSCRDKLTLAGTVDLMAKLADMNI